MRVLLISAIAVCAFGSPAAFAVGLGNLTVNSKLGEPLNVEVELISTTPAEADTMQVELATRRDFSQAGIAYPDIADLLNFDVIRGVDDNYSIRITTTDPVNETFLHVLLSASWSGGTAIREYTALLDPPLYSGDSAVAVETPVTSAEDAGSVDSQSVPVTRPSGAVSSGTPVADGDSVPDSVLVRRGDTLSGIVARLGLTDSVSLYQALSAMLEANPEAFIDNNMNRLRADVSLSVPDISTMRAISDSAARSQFVYQVNAYNQYLASIGYGSSNASEAAASAPGDSQPVAQVPSPTEDTSSAPDAGTAVPEETPVQSDTAPQPDTAEQSVRTDDAGLTIGQETGSEEFTQALAGDQGENAQMGALKDQLAALDESLLASGVENDEVKQRLKDIQAQVDRMSRLLDIEESGLALAQNVASDEPQGASQAGGETPDQDSGDTVSDESVSLTDNGGTASVSEEDNPQAADSSQQSEVSTAVETAGEPATATVPATKINTAEPGLNNATGQSDSRAQAESAEHTQVSGSDTTAIETIKSGFSDNLTGVFGFLSNHMLSIGAALVALLAGMVFYRRRQPQQELEVSIASGIDFASRNSELDLTLGGEMSYLSDDAIAGVAEEENEVVQTGAVDPLAEAEVYLAYDRDEQAIQVLKEAYARDPERMELANKLFEIYHQQDDGKAFDSLAVQVQNRIGNAQSPAWLKIAAMGKEVSPDNSLYAEVFEMPDGTAVGLELETAPADQTDITDLDIDELLSNTSLENSLTKPAETAGLDIDDEIFQEELTLDTPTLSQVVSAVQVGDAGGDNSVADDAQSADDDDGLLEFDLGEDDRELPDEADAQNPSLASAALELDQQPESEIMEKMEQTTGGDMRVLDAEEPAELTEDAVIDPAESAYSEGDSELSISNLEPYHESETALELAKAYLELGEKDIAKGFIEEVINDGSEKQRIKAEKLVKELVD